MRKVQFQLAYDRFDKGQVASFSDGVARALVTQSDQDVPYAKPVGDWHVEEDGEIVEDTDGSES